MSQSKLLFKYLEAINSSKRNYLLEKNSDECRRFSKEYLPFMIGGFLGGSLDAVNFANEANTSPKMSPERHFVYLLHSIPRKRRFVKWPKKTKNEDIAERLSIYYDVSLKKAREYVELHTKEEIHRILEVVSDLK